ncbi:MAG: DUF2127 domain-containing protein [Rhodobacteraceae bacterium]|nr:DUF2127 domain-containing protein [Paracoccaceae bacterium]
MSSLSAGADPHRAAIRRSALGRWLHWLFGASLVIKGLLASAEALAGLGLLLTPNDTILRFVAWLTRHEIAQDPTDPMATWMRHAAEAFPGSTQHFYALYLMGHGILKLGMVVLLARRVRWAYPAAMAVLAGFVVYQVHHALGAPSPVLVVLSLFDSAMILLVWREWRELVRAGHWRHTPP